jgi:hypothetical protein
MTRIFLQLLCVRPGGRISSLEQLRKVKCLHDINLESVLEKRIKPSFTPPVSSSILTLLMCLIQFNVSAAPDLAPLLNFSTINKLVE